MRRSTDVCVVSGVAMVFLGDWFGCSRRRTRKMLARFPSATRLRPTARRRALSTLVDLAAYPINRLDSHGGQLLLRHCHKQLSEQGFVALSGFLTPAAVAAMLDEAKSLSAENGFYSTESHNVFLEEGMPDDLPESHPRRVIQSSSKLLFAADQLSSHSPLREVYEWPPLLEFIRAALQRPQLHLSVDPMASHYLNIFSVGDQLGWHFDNSEFSVSLVLQPSVEGGAFEFAPASRDAVSAQCAFEPDALDVRRPPLHAGSLYLFHGRDSLHRVSEVRQGERINAILAYNTDGSILNEYTRRKFFGRDL